MGLLFRLAWRNIWRHTRRSVITASAMGFGVALCMFYLTFAGGMFRMMFDIAVGQNIGHAQIHAPDYPKRKALFDVIEDANTVEKKLRALPEVAQTTSRVYGYGLLGVGDEAGGAQLIGISPADEDTFRELSKMVKSGAYLEQRPPHKGEPARRPILLGHRLAEDLKAKIGDEVVAVTSAADGSMGNELFTLVGTVSTGNTAVDKAGAYILKPDAQALFAVQDGVHEIAVKAADQALIDPMVARLRIALPDDKVHLVRPWGEIQPQLFQMLSMQDALLLIVAFLIFGVASLGILNTMLMSVFERTKELGVMIALGLRPWQIVTIILLETTVLSALAVTFGVALGSVSNWYLVEHGFNWGTSIDMMGMHIPEVIYGHARMADTVVTVVLVFIISILASVWPALRAARLQPVLAMRDQ